MRKREYVATVEEKGRLAFADIPMAERVHVKIIQRDDAFIEEGYERVRRAREWLTKEFLPKLGA